jgi:pyruvate kinase
VQNTAAIGERKNMNLPGAVVTLPTLTEKVRERESDG